MPDKRKPGDYPGDTFDERLSRLIEDLANAGFPVKVTSRVRSAEEQAKLYAKGRTSGGAIVTEKSGKPGDESRHQKGLAADLAFVNGGFNGPWDKVGEYAKQEGLEWGGDWTSLKDRPHVQMPTQSSFPRGGSAVGTTTSSHVTDAPPIQTASIMAQPATPTPPAANKPLFPDVKLPDPGFLKPGQPVRNAIDSGVNAIKGVFLSKDQPAAQPTPTSMPINYKALYDLSTSKDPEAQKIAAQASKNLTPKEAKEFFDFQNQLHQSKGIDEAPGEFNRQDNSLFGLDPGAVVAVGPGLAKGVVSGGISGMGRMAGDVAKMWAVVKGMEMAGAPREAINAVMITLGLKGGMGAGASAAAEAEAATLAKGKAFGERTMPMSDAEYEAAVGRTRSEMPPAPAKASNAYPPNVIKQDPRYVKGADRIGPDSPTQDIIEQVTGSTRQTSPKIADPTGFERVLEAELGWIAKQRGAMPVGSGADYAGWSAAQDAKFPPSSTSLDDLATKGLASLRRKPK